MAGTRLLIGSDTALSALLTCLCLVSYSHTNGMAIASNLGLSILPKDTMTRSLSWGIGPLTSLTRFYSSQEQTNQRLKVFFGSIVGEGETG